MRRNLAVARKPFFDLGRVAYVGFIAGMLLVAAAGPASAHARLISTDPAGGATLEEEPANVRLIFSERIETTFAGVQVFGPDRKRVESGEARVEGERVIVPLVDDLPGGRYTVVFRIISGDGHPVKSQFRFTYDAPAPAPTEPASEEPSAAAPTATETPSGAPVEQTPADEPVFELEDAGAGTTFGLLAARFITYAALAALAGYLLAALFLMPTGFGVIHRRLVRGAAVAAGLLVIADIVLFAFALSSVSARPIPQALNADLASRFLETRFGVTVLAQAGVAAVVAVVAALARKRRSALAAAGLAGLAAAAIPWWGHAGTDEMAPLALLSAFAHIVAAAVWVGGLVLLIALVRRRDADPGNISIKFSRVAAWAFGIVLATGVVNAALHMGAVANLWETSWGRLVIGKLIVIAVIAGFGWRNRNVLLPRLSGGSDDARTAFRRFAMGEVAVMVAAFGLAAGLASGIPADAEAASRIQSVVSQFGDGQINVTVDPAEVGPNLVHLYFLDTNGRQREVENPALTFDSGGEVLEAQLLPAGPGHYTVLSQQFPAPGEYEMRVQAEVGTKAASATATVNIR